MAKKKAATGKTLSKKVVTDKKALKKNILRAIDRQLSTTLDVLSAGTYGRPDNGGYYTRPD